MKNRSAAVPIIFFLIWTADGSAFPVFPVDAASSNSTDSKTIGAFQMGIYSNLFSECLGKSETQNKTKLDGAFARLFHGNDDSQRIYYPVGQDMAYIKDILNDDVRTEGMSYGMMIAVEMDRKKEFDSLWKWAKTHMQHAGGPHRNFFAWHCRTDGTKIDFNSAPDGEEWFVTSLFFASARWGDGKGIFDYKAEARAILGAMLHQDANPESNGRIVNMFDREKKQVVFVPTIQLSGFTDPSYHLPHFYELWALWADQDNGFWRDAARSSREFLKKTAHPSTGLTPDYADFDGSPVDPWNRGHGDFRYDAWRTAMNIAVDYAWFKADPWAVEQSNRLLRFFHSQGMGRYGSQYTLDGKQLQNDHSPGLVAMNAAACLAATDGIRRDFIEELWNIPVPDGAARYFDGMLYMLALLQVGGQFRVYGPQ
jgi:oligosaccharide reducing-end xylanase